MSNNKRVFKKYAVCALIGAIMGILPVWSYSQCTPKISSATDPQAFTLVNANFNGIDVGSFSTPTITDIDHDGLLDLIIGKQDGTLSHYEQAAVNSLTFTLITSNFNGIDVGFYSAPTFTDLDGDGLLDLLVGELDGNLNHYEQAAINSPTFTLVTTTFNGIDVFGDSAPTFTDLDGDGLVDLIIGNGDGIYFHYEQSAANSLVFNLVTNTYLGVDIGSYSTPTFTDFDGDGLLDFVSGISDGNILYFKQNSANSTVFTGITPNFNQIDVGFESTPTFTDLDNDGMSDLLIGEGLGNINHYEQSRGSFTAYSAIVGTPTAAQSVKVWSSCLAGNITVTAPTGFEVSLSQNSGFGSSVTLTPTSGKVVNTTVYVRFNPSNAGTFSGNLALISPSATTVNYPLSGTACQPQISSATDPQAFTLVNANFNGIDLGIYSKPAITDIDHDGLLDLIIGTNNGTLSHYEQAAINSPTFTLISSNFNGIDVDFFSAPTFTDLDGDGLLDLIVGELDGNLNHYEQSALNSLTFNLVTNSFNGIDVGLDSAPTFTDLDGDGFLDLIIGNRDGFYYYYEQSALNSLAFNLVTNTYLGVDIGGYSTPTFTDFDGDGLLDFMSGIENGNVLYFKQNAANSTVFTGVTPNFSQIAVGQESAPTFTDLDNDGMSDLLIGERDGNINHYEQSRGSFTAYSTIVGTPTAAQSVKVWSSCVAGNITVTAPTGFEVSLSQNSGFGSSVTLTPTSGKVVNTMVYVRFNPSSSGIVTSDLQLTSTNATTVTYSLSGCGISIPSNPSATQTICSGKTATLSATCASGSVVWYDVSSGGVGTTTNSFTTPTLNNATAATQTTSYYASCENTAALNCTGTRLKIDVNVLPIPTVSITGLNAAYCKSEAAVTLTGSPSSGTFTIDGIAATSIIPPLLSGGDHIVIYTYPLANCTYTATQTVKVNALPSFTQSITNVSCVGSSDGKIVLSTTGAVSYEISPITGTQSPVGTFNNLTAQAYSIKATDINGCQSTTNITVGTALDTEKPVITCPTPLSKNTDLGVCGAVVTFATPTATDNCSGATVSRTSSLASGVTFPVGVSTVVFTATDAASNTATCSFTVTVTDNEKPKVTCPTPLSKNTDLGVCGAVVTFATPTATDNCSGVTVSRTSSLASGATFPVGVSTVVFTATDASNNTSTCSFTITVTDNQKPTITAPANISLCAGINVVLGTPTRSDNCSIATVTNNAPSSFPVGTTTVVWTATDVNSNTQTATQTVTIIPLPTPSVSGSSGVCTGATLALTGSTTTGTTAWSSSNTAIATVSSTGVVTGISAGTVIITYTVTQNTCSASATKTILVTATPPVPNLIVATPTCMVQNGGSITLTNLPSGYASQINGGVATVDKTVYSGLTAGSYTIKVSKNGCEASKTVVVTEILGLDPTKCYKLTNRNSGFVLNVLNSLLSNNAEVFQNTSNNGANQKWQFSALGSDFFKVMAKHSSKFLANHLTADNTHVYQYDYQIGGAVDWKLVCVGNGYYRLQHKLSGKYLSILGNSTLPLIPTIIQPLNTTNLAQQWQIVEVPCTTTQSLASLTSLSFDATAEQTRARLAWVSNLGATTDYFTVQKQDNQTGKFIDLEKINNKFSDNEAHYFTAHDSQPTEGDNEAHYFTAYDSQPTEGDNIYRIQLTLNDGTTKLTATQKVRFEGLYSVRLFPNPASDEVQVDLSAYAGFDVSLFVYNSYGIQVAHYNLQKASKLPFAMDISSLESGTFIVRVASKGKRDVMKQLVIIK